MQACIIILIFCIMIMAYWGWMFHLASILDGGSSYQEKLEAAERLALREPFYIPTFVLRSAARSLKEHDTVLSGFCDVILIKHKKRWESFAPILSDYLVEEPSFARAKSFHFFKSIGGEVIPFLDFEIQEEEAMSPGNENKIKAIQYLINEINLGSESYVYGGYKSLNLRNTMIGRDTVSFC